MHLKYALVADKVEIKNGKTNILDVSNLLLVPRLPFRYSLTAIFGIEGSISDAGRHDMDIVVCDSDGQWVSQQFPVKLDFPVIPNAPVVGVDLVITGPVEFQAPGRYVILARMDNRHLGSVSFYVDT